MSTACLFPGQGSQSKGMGADLFDRFPDWTAAADATLGYSIRALCVDDPRGELGSTAFTQPALFVVNAMTYRARMDDGAAAPGFLAGHSLGEYNALLAAGVFNFATGLELVRRRGELMGRVSGGGMAAVVGATPAEIAAILGQSEAGRRLDVANFNSYDQTVIAGGVDDLALVRIDFEKAGVRAYIPLKVSAAFHSRQMRAPMDEFADVLRSVTFDEPRIAVISNVTARPYVARDARETLSRQIGSSVNWLGSMEYLLAQGVTDFQEVGPGKVLTKLAASIRKARSAQAPTGPSALS